MTTAFRLVLAIAVRPALWAVALRQARVLARPGWWKVRPWLPVPDAQYVRFRSSTAYGDPGHDPEADDVIAYLRWCRSWRAIVSSDGEAA